MDILKMEPKQPRQTSIAILFLVNWCQVSKLDFVLILLMDSPLSYCHNIAQMHHPKDNQISSESVK